MTPRRLLLDGRFWLVTAAAVAAVGVTASLGRWQLDRAAQKQALQSGIDARARWPALDAAGLAARVRVGAVPPPDDLLHRPVALQGRWLAHHTVYLDNRQMLGRQGFFVVTPLQLEQSPVVVLVQRGWVPRNFQDRTALPPLATPGGTVQLTGRTAATPGRLLALEGSDNATQKSRIRQNLDLEAFRAETGLPLANVTVLQTGDAGDGLLRQWPAISTGIDKHHGYAFQWFGLSGLIAALYVWFQLVRRFRPSRSTGA